MILVLVLNKDDKPNPPPPSPPDPDIPNFNPYEVYQSDPATMSYKLKINPNLKDSFKFPFNDTLNNFKFTNISLNGNNAFEQGKTLRFTFSGDESSAEEVRVHKKNLGAAQPQLNLSVDIGT